MATLEDGTAIDYSVDGLGRRVAKRVDGTVTQRYPMMARIAKTFGCSLEDLRRML